MNRRESLLWEAIGTPCPLCGYPMRIGQALDLDHVIPQSKGGRSGPVRVTHDYCNRSRQDREAPVIKARGPRKIRTCVICGQRYWPGYSQQRACSRPCGRELARRNRPPSVRQPPELPVCSECGMTFRRSNRRGPGKTCSPQCRKTRERRRRLEKYVPRPQKTCTCRICGQTFEGTSRRTLCSDKCRARAKYLRRREREGHV
jgi:hypothetical protein